MADKIAHVQGVLHYNDSTREEMLRRIYWKDAQYTRFGGNFVKYADIKERSAGSLTDGDGLFVYTYDRGKPYGSGIWRDYLGNNLRTRNVYSNEPGTPNGLRWKWEGDYLENFTKDTKLQRIGDIEVTRELAVATYAKNDRHMTEKYITPELNDFYGSSPGLNTKLFKYTFGQYYTGRISDIEEADVPIEHDYLKYLFSGSTADITEAESSEVFNNPNVEAPKRHMAEMLFQAQKITGKSYLAEGERYVKPSDFNADGRVVLDNIDEFQDVHGGFYGMPVGNGRSTNKRGLTTRFDEGDYENDNNTNVNQESGPFVFTIPQGSKKSLLSKTNELFKKHKIATLSGRFHTTASEVSPEIDITDTAKSTFGNSHGRNLLKKNPYEDNDTNGYENPYCRVWTYHHQYDRASRLIRPFSETIPDKEFDSMVYTYTAKPNERTSSGFENLRLNTVLRKDGYLNIAPKGDACGNITTEVKKCMFSLENLAWKDVPRNQGYISKEQRGPNGGRIMWFPPYDLDFNESVSVNWNQSNFIGRGESVYTYGNTTRQGTLSFAILIDHPSIINNIPKYNLKENGTSDEDFESDVLRFFAGCAVPNLVGKLDCNENENNKPNGEGKNDGDEPKLDSPSEEKGKHIKFYVFYPNNYSGNGSYLNNWQWDVGGSSDVDWYDYIFIGKDTKIADSASEGFGYEMNRSGGGVTGPSLSPTKNDLINNGEFGENGYINVHAKHITGKLGEGLVENVWYQYRVDYDLHEKLFNRLPGKALYTRGMTAESNYFDSANFRLNCSKDNVPKDATHTFAQIVGLIKAAFPNAFAGKKVNSINTDTYINGLSDKDDLINAFKNHKFQKVVMKAGATSQDSVNSVTLAQRRGRSLRDLLKNEGEVNVQFDPPEIVTTDKLNDPTTINSLEAKLQRYASVELWYDVPETQKLSDTVHAIVNDNETGSGESSTPEWDDNDSPTSKIDRNLNPSIVVADAVAIATEGANMSSRYETEAEFFHELEKEHPNYYTSLIKKFKYFSPAYHSISPEGFNARLTFLQQCTRQGHTISATDLNFAKTAGNLAFGRMPVCVLRIGDFINTKILINSMSINYGASGNPQWDLNPEGIGVQPMYAKVQLGITILGGQSLDGPINRLQNAVSFNYYANTGVYDDRADRINSKMVKKVFNKDGDEVRVETVETSGDKLKIYDTSEYGVQRTSYEHIWSPYPNLVVKDDYNNNIASYNEYMAAGGTKGVVKDENGKYKVRQ